MNPERTAIKRKKPSLPIQDLIKKNLINGKFLDYGGGHGQDFLHTEKKFNTYYWDPFRVKMQMGDNIIFHEMPNSCPFEPNTFDTITVTYVLNVLPPMERKNTIDHILSLLKPNGIAYFTVRGPKDKISGTPYEDGLITKKNTFQRTFSPEQLMEFLPTATLITNKGNYVTVSVQKP